jgi:hypothetical protein
VLNNPLVYFCLALISAVVVLVSVGNNLLFGSVGSFCGIVALRCWFLGSLRGSFGEYLVIYFQMNSMRKKTSADYPNI